MYCKVIFPFRRLQSFRFQKKSFGKNVKVIITIDGRIRDEKLQHNNNIKVAKISILALASGKVDKYIYRTGDEILPQARMKQQAKFSYFSFV